LSETPPTIIALSGSLRRASYNTALLRAAIRKAPPEVRVEHASIEEIPLYNADIEAEQGFPEPVRELKERIASAAGLLLVSPEYNHSVPGVLKNAIDWVSRPGSDIPRVFGGLPVAVIGASQGRMGTVLSQAAWLPVLRALGTRPWFEAKLLVSSAQQVFTEAGELTDARVEKELTDFMTGFAAFVVEQGR